MKDLIWFKTVLEIQSLLLKCPWTNLPNSKPSKSFILRMFSFFYVVVAYCSANDLTLQWILLLYFEVFVKDLVK